MPTDKPPMQTASVALMDFKVVIAISIAVVSLIAVVLGAVTLQAWAEARRKARADREYYARHKQ